MYNSPLKHILAFAAYTPTSESIFTTVGTSSFTVPANVYEISAICIGGGGAGGASAATGTAGGGGGGGALAYRTFPVVPGTFIQVVVGGGGLPTASNTGTVAHWYTPSSGSASWVTSSGVIMVKANGGTGGPIGLTTAAPGGTVAAGTGGSGGSGGAAGANGASGGGGAGGYSGTGGNGSSGAGAAGTGGGGGGGGASAAGGGGGGGGVGLYGSGSNGAAGAAPGGGGGGSGGANGSAPPVTGDGGNGGLYGGGGGGGDDVVGKRPSSGSQGAVRLIWGVGRRFPTWQSATGSYVYG